MFTFFFHTPFISSFSSFFHFFASSFCHTYTRFRAFTMPLRAPVLLTFTIPRYDIDAMLDIFALYFRH